MEHAVPLPACCCQEPLRHITLKEAWKFPTAPLHDPEDAKSEVATSKREGTFGEVDQAGFRILSERRKTAPEHTVSWS